MIRLVTFTGSVALGKAAVSGPLCPDPANSQRRTSADIRPASFALLP
jgi:hypothetical protein